MRDIDELPRFMGHRLNIWKSYFGIEDIDMRFRATLDASLGDDEPVRLNHDAGVTTMRLSPLLIVASDEDLDQMAFRVVLLSFTTVLAALSVTSYKVEKLKEEKPDTEIPEKFLDAGRREGAMTDRLAHLATNCIWPLAGCSLYDASAGRGRDETTGSD